MCKYCNNLKQYREDFSREKMLGKWKDDIQLFMNKKRVFEKLKNFKTCEHIYPHIEKKYQDTDWCCPVLTDEQGDNVWEKNVRWAQNHLSAEGKIYFSKRHSSWRCVTQS